MAQIPSDELKAIRARLNDRVYLKPMELIDEVVSLTNKMPRLLDAYESALAEIEKLEDFIESTTPGLNLVKEIERIQAENKRVRQVVAWIRQRFEKEWTYEIGTGEVVDEIIMELEKTLEGSE